MLYERRHPAAPWLTPEAIRPLSTMLASNRGLEFGSGRSTIWCGPARGLDTAIFIEPGRAGSRWQSRHQEPA